MPELVDAIVVTRQGETGHEDLGSQVNRINPRFWDAYSENRRSAARSEQVLTRWSQFAPTQSEFIRQSDTSAPPTELDPQSDVRALREYLQQIRATLRESLGELSLAIVTRATSDTSVLVSMCRNDRRFSATGGRRLEHAPRDAEWNDTKNRRRCELVDKEIDGTITGDEQSELDELQAQMLAYRRKVAPLPLEDVRRLHQELLRRAGPQSVSSQ